MSHLFLVREELVRVEDLAAGDRLILPDARRVTVERVDVFDDCLIVRWWRPADRGEPGHRGGKQHVDDVSGAYDGRYLGSTQPHQRGDTLRVDRG